MNMVRFGILGCADIAKRRAIPALKKIDTIDLVGIASRDSNKAKTFCSEFGIKKAYTYDELIEADDIDAIYVPLPVGLIKEWAIKAANTGKHVICEKSISGNFDSVKKIVDVCKKNKVVLFENFICDYHPQHAKVYDLIKNGELGETFVFQGNFGFNLVDKSNIRYSKELAGGSLNDAGAYTVFMASKFFGEPISLTSKLIFKNGIDIQGSVMLEFPGNKVGILCFGFENVYQNNYSIWGSQGLVRVERAYSIPFNMPGDITLVKNDLVKESILKIKADAVDQFKLIFEDFINTIKNKDNQKIEVNYQKILNQARVMEAIRISARENRKVFFKEIK